MCVRSSRLRRLLPVLVVLGGVLLLSYPLVSTVWNNYQERLVSRAYVGHVNTQADTDKRAYMQAALDYNEAKTANVFIDPYRDQEAHGSAVASSDYDEYMSVLANGVGPMAVVSIPKISVSLPVYHGTSHSTLQRGAGHLFGSDLPVGGGLIVTRLLPLIPGLRTRPCLTNLPTSISGIVFILISKIRPWNTELRQQR